MNRTWNTRSVTRLALAAGLAFSVTALPALADPPASPAKPDQPALKGPDVQDNHAPGADGSFGGQPDFKKAAQPHPIPPRLYHEAIGAVLAPDAADNIRATQDQKDKIKAIMEDFRKQMRDYMQAHKDEFQSLRETLRANRPHRGPGGPDAAPPPAQDQPKDAGKPADDSVRQAREKLRALMEAGPKPKDAFDKVWQILTPDQQKAVQARLDELKKQADQRHEHMRGGRRGPHHPGGPDGQGGPQGQGHGRGAPGAGMFPPRGERGPAFAGGPGRVDPQMRDRLLNAFSRLSPEQQAHLLNRLEGRFGGPRPHFRGPDAPPAGQGDPMPPPPESDGPPPAP